MMIAKRDCRGCGRDIIACRGIEACERCGTVYAGKRSAKVGKVGASIIRTLALRPYEVSVEELILAVYYLILEKGEGEASGASTPHRIYNFVSESKLELARAGLAIKRQGWRGYRLEVVDGKR